MGNTRIGDLSTFTGNASGSFLVMNNADNTTTFKITRETLLAGATASYAVTASYALNGGSGGTIDTGSFATTGSNTFRGNQIISGSLTITSATSSGFTSNADTLLFVGTASFTGLNTFTSSITIENVSNPTSLFLIKSGSTTYLNVSSSGNTELYSNLFIIKNFTNQQPVLTVSQSIVQFATQSLIPTGNAPNGGIWFTSASMYVGLD